NIPTEEVFTMPHRAKVEGVVTSSKPLSHNGSLIEDFQLRFSAGRVVEARAGRGEAALHELLASDEGAARLGEVALVPASSPVGQAGILFYNTLFDENAASHLALGRAYRFTLEGGEAMTAEEAMAAGVNESLEHVDFMIGSAEMDVDGVTTEGAREAVMRAGEWAL
ncbi:MAG TPA: aminopeptidase, partial [Trueperaceae bacterium]